MLRQTLTGRVQKGDWRRRMSYSLVNTRPVVTSQYSREVQNQHIADLQNILQIFSTLESVGTEAQSVYTR